MPQDKKRPVTYGKSPLKRIESYLDWESSSRTPISRTSPAGKPAARASNSSTYSLRPIQPSLLLKNPAISSSSEEDEQNAMHRKRRKFLSEEAREDPQVPISRQMNTDVPTRDSRVDVDICDSKKSIKESTRRHRDQHSYDTPLSTRADDSSETESVSRVISPRWRSALRQEPVSLSTASSILGFNGRSTQSFMDATQNAADCASARKRLVDSLGTAGQNSASGSKPDDSFEPDQIIHDKLVGKSAPGRRLPRRNLSRSDTSDTVRSQGKPATPLPFVMRSPRVTYSRQRSFLNDTPSMIEDGPRSVEDSSKFTTSKVPHHQLPSHISPDDDEGNNSKPVRSIHELRQAGDNARFRETIDSIFDDIEDVYNSTSDRCCRFAELCVKLLDPQFVGRFSEQGFGERLVNCTSDNLDIVSASLALSAYNLIVGGGQSSRILSESIWSRILVLSPSLLNTDEDILILAKEPSLGLSKPAQAFAREVRSHFLSKTTSQYLSPRLLALECIRTSLINSREDGLSIQPIPASLLDRLVDLLVSKAQGELNFPLSGDHFHLLELIFSVLENYSIMSEALDDDHRRCFRRLAQLHGLFTPAANDQKRQILMFYIRVILNLTNKEPLLCDNFATPELVSGLMRIITTESREISRDFSAKGNSALNAVILALGALINLAERAEQSRAIFIQSAGDSIPFLQQLLEQFSRSVSSMDQAHSVPEVHQNVVAGYLSILLLSICLDSEARYIVKRSLAGNGLVMVLSTAQKFLQYHREVEQDSHLLGPWDEEESELTTRLEHIINQIIQHDKSPSS